MKIVKFFQNRRKNIPKIIPHHRRKNHAIPHRAHRADTLPESRIKKGAPAPDQLLKSHLLYQLS